MPSRFDDVYSTDVEHHGFYVDMTPSTLLEQSQNGGYERTTMPAGGPVTMPTKYETTGGRGLTDTEAAVRLGATGNKK